MELPELNRDDLKIDNKKFKEIIKKLRENRNLATDIQDIVENNQQIRRNATNIARDMPLSAGQEVSLNDRKKMQKQQNLARQLYKQGLTSVKGEVLGVIVPQGAKKASAITSHTFLPSSMEDDKWQLQAAVIKGYSFVAVCNCGITTGINRIASKLIGMDAYGPIIFIHLDKDYVPVDMDITLFKSLLE
jgi:hypothetical protein